MTGQPVQVYVRTLVLNGLPAVEAERVGRELARELTRLLDASERPISRVGSATAVRGGTLELGREPIEMTIGAQVARSVHGRLRP